MWLLEWRHTVLVAWAASWGCGLLPADAVLGECAAAVSGAPMGELPNFVIFMTDDQDAMSVKVMRSVDDEIGRKGVTFRESFVTTPLCCPARASALRGQYAHNHGVLTNGRPEGGWPSFHGSGAEQSTLATWLQDAGYRTALVGKYLNLYPDGDSVIVPPGWSEWYALSTTGREGTDYYGFTIIANGVERQYGSRMDEYQTDVLADLAVDVVRRAAVDSRPFFLWIAPYAPHLPATPAPRHQGTFASLRVQRPPSFGEDNVSDKPEWIQHRKAFSASVGNYLDNVHRSRLETLLSVDDMVSAVIGALEQGDLDAETYVLFTSDNGFHIGEHRLLTGKSTSYEESIRVPLLVRGPGVMRDCTRDELVANIDLAPTVAELAGVDVPSFVDGRSFVRLLRHSPMAGHSWRRRLLIENWWQHDGVGFETFAVRSRTHTYVEWSTGEVELYDLNSDPYQLNNLSGRWIESVTAEMSTSLNELRECRGEACRVAENR